MKIQKHLHRIAVTVLIHSEIMIKFDCFQPNYPPVILTTSLLINERKPEYFVTVNSTIVFVNSFTTVSKCFLVKGGSRCVLL